MTFSSRLDTEAVTVTKVQSMTRKEVTVAWLDPNPSYWTGSTGVANSNTTIAKKPKNMVFHRAAIQRFTVSHSVAGRVGDWWLVLTS